MEILRTILAKEDHPHRVNFITFNIDEKKAYVIIEPSSESSKTVVVDVMSLLSMATTTQKNTIKGFLKSVIGAAIEIDSVNLPDIFNE